MKCPLISVIIPVYNVEKYLVQCIDSVINQPYKNLEILLVDDGSPDRCPEICDEYAKKDDRIIVIHKKNGGLSDARNCGVTAATGKYILFIDSDDFIHENIISEMVQDLNEHGDVDLMFLEAFKYSDKEQRSQSLGDGYNKKCIVGKSQLEVMRHLATLPKYPASACTKLISTKLIKEQKLYFLKGITTEDIEWSIRLFMASKKFSYCSAPYYCYRQNREGSITNSCSDKKFSDFLSIIKMGCIYAKENPEFNADIYSFMAYEYNILLSTYSRLGKSEKPKYSKEIKKHSWLLNCRQDKKTKLIKIVYNAVGLELTSKMLFLYLKIRG